MKFLALERPTATASPGTLRRLLPAEARRAWTLYLAGVLREFYFTPHHEAVLVLECANRPAARRALASLPLVREKQIRFELLPLTPYTGFERLFAKTPRSTKR